MISVYEYNDGIAFIIDDDVENELAFYNRYSKILSYYEGGVFTTDIDYDTLIYITSEIIRYEERIKDEVDKDE